MIILAGLATVWRGPRWPVMSARFDRAGQPGQPVAETSRFGDDVGVAEPGHRPDARRRGGPGGPAIQGGPARWRHPYLTPGRRRGGPVSVLLAEHEPEVAEMSARYLRRDGLRVRLVTTPELALTELTSGPDAAAVLDLTMPGLDPRHIRRALRTPVILLVAGPGHAA